MLLADLTTEVGLVLSFAIFMTMAVKELRTSGIAAVRNIKFQLAVAVFVWLVAESLTVAYSMAYASEDLVMQIHTISMGIFALIVVTRLPRLVKRSN